MTQIPVFLRVTRRLAPLCFAAFAAAGAHASAGDLQPAAVQPSVAGQAASGSEGPKRHFGGKDGRAVYIVRLSDAAVAVYKGGLPELAATSPLATGAARLDVNAPASVAYADYLKAEQNAFVEHCEHAFSRTLDVPFTYQNAFNGVAMELTPDEARAIAGLPEVISIQRERFEVPLTDDGPKLIGAPTIWRGSHYPWRPGNMGEGAVVAVLDSGINFDHPSFADIGGDGYDHDNPLGSGNYIPGSYCDVVDPSFCNDKLIGAWALVQGPDDPTSPDDSDGHGSHTASTAAGNVIPDATIEAPTTSLTRRISGVAPHANIIAYDVCIDSCPGSALLAAMEQVVIDASSLPNGIQSLNYSISGGNDPYNDAIEIAFLNAVAAGIYVSTSAGNAGPGPATTGHNSPWVSATAASTHRRALEASVTLGATAGNALRAWLAAETNTMATLSGFSLDVSRDNADILAGFSSRGPNSSIDVLKPDIAAPGVDIIAALSSDLGLAAPEFGFLSGTSMASPHNAGSAALLSNVTKWTPQEIKSALMMTAHKPRRMLKEDGVTAADPFDAGAGRINLRRVRDAGLVMHETPANFLAADPDAGGDPRTLNIASMADSGCVEGCGWTRTVTNRSHFFGGWRVSARNANGVTFKVDPEWMFLRPGESEEITVKADTTLGEPGYAFSELNLKPFGGYRPKLHMPIAVNTTTSTNPTLLNKTVDLAEAVEGDVLNYEISVVNGPITDVIEIEDPLPEGLAYVPGSATAVLVNGTEVAPLDVSGNTVSWAGTLDPGGIDVADGIPSPAGYLPLAVFGFTPVTLPGNADDGGLIFSGLPPFGYNGGVYTDVIMSINGTLEAGTASGLATGGAVSRLPSADAPNNLLAPLWADLNATDSGDLYVGILSDGVNDFIIFEWAGLPLFSDPTASYSFQIWIVAGTDLIWFTYGGISSTAIPMTVGAENATGTNGDSYFHNSDGASPEGTEPGLDLLVSTLDGGVGNDQLPG